MEKTYLTDMLRQCSNSELCALLPVMAVLIRKTAGEEGMSTEDYRKICNVWQSIGAALAEQLPPSERPADQGPSKYNFQGARFGGGYAAPGGAQFGGELHD